MKKSYILIILISFLVISPKLYAQVECPCDFDVVPKTTGCWADQYPNPPIYHDMTDITNRNFCETLNFRNEPRVRQIGFGVGGGTVQPSSPSFCSILVFNLDDCFARLAIFHDDITPEEVRACQCELLAYTTALNEVDGIEVTGGPPYVCGDVDCRPVILSPIPTLSEWGLIAMAGILGIVGYLVIRRRKVTA